MNLAIVRILAAFLIASFTAIPAVVVRTVEVQAIANATASPEERIARTQGHVERAHAIAAAPREGFAPFAVGPALLAPTSTCIAAATWIAASFSPAASAGPASAERASPRARGPPLLA